MSSNFLSLNPSKTEFLIFGLPQQLSKLNRAIQWHYIDKLSNDTVPNYTFITTNHQALFIYIQTKITE